ncbi:MAG: metallophosphoesterase family protein [Candidatus Heimdallarchaeaceae archaeon]
MRDSAVRIIHFGDTHITSRPQFVSSEYFAAVNEINSVANRLKVDFGVFSGDLTQDGLFEDYVFANKLRELIKLPKIHWIIGNHDSRSGGFEVWEKMVGERDFFYVDEKVLFIGLDSCVPDRDSGRFGRKAFDFAKKILTKFGEDRIKIVAFHHHLLPIPKVGRERSNAVDSGEMLSILLDYGVDAVFTGHKHHPNVYKVEDTIIISSGSISSYKTRSGEPHSFNLVEIRPQKDVKIKTINTKGNALHEEIKTITRSFRMVNSSGGKWLRIVQLSGTDFGSSWNKQFEYFKKGMKLIDETNPDVIIHNGNLTYSGYSDEYEQAIEHFLKYKEKFIFCPGPRDLRGYGESLLNKYFDIEHLIEKENSNFYILNTSEAGTDIGVVGRRTQLKLHRYVHQTKKEKSKQFNSVVMHHHLVPIPGTRETSALEDAGDVLRLLVDTNVNLVLSGHLGKAFCTRVEKTVFVNCNTFSSQKTASSENSFNIIDISSDGAIVVSEVFIPSNFRRILGIFPGTEINSNVNSKII